MIDVVPIYRFVENTVTALDSQCSAISVSRGQVDWGSHREPGDHTHLFIVSRNDHLVELYQADHIDNDFSNCDKKLCFLTIDSVRKIQHCLHGNFITTLEYSSMCNSYSIRSFVNWNKLRTRSSKRPEIVTKTRIADKVTPTTNSLQTPSIEMIQLILENDTPHDFECCQSSGNILVLCNQRKSLKIFEFEIRQNDVLKVKFIDFKPLTLDICIPVESNAIGLAENCIFYRNRTCLHVMQLFRKVSKQTVLNEFCIKNCYAYDTEINFKENSKTSTTKFPKIEHENSQISKLNKVIFNDLTVLVSHMEDVFVRDLINIRLEGDNIEKVLMKPYYVTNNTVLRPAYSNGDPLIGSEHNSSSFHHIKVFVAFKSDGYLYQFFNEEPKCDFSDRCIGVYSFTNSVSDAIMDDYCLYIGNPAGLETFSLNLGPKIAKKLPFSPINLLQTKLDESIVMFGTNTFFKITNLYVCGNEYVYLVANDSGNLTLYRLKLMDIDTVLCDILNYVNENDTISDVNSFQLMRQVHNFSKIYQLFLKMVQKNDNTIPIVEFDKQSNATFICAFKETSLYLATYFIISMEKQLHKLVYEYFKMSQRSLVEFLTFILEKSDVTKIHGIFKFLSDYYTRNYENSVIKNEEKLAKLLLSYDDDVFVTMLLEFPNLRQSLSTKTIKVLQESNVSEACKVQLLLSVMCTEKGCESGIYESFIVNEEDSIQTMEKYPKLLFEIRKPSESNPIDVLFDGFSDFAVQIFEKDPEIFFDLIFEVVTEHHFTSHTSVIQFLFDIMATKSTTSVWKSIYEFLERCYEHNHKILNESHVKALIRFYWQKLMCEHLPEEKQEEIDNENDDSDTSSGSGPKVVHLVETKSALFKYRFTFLDKIEPFVNNIRLSQNALIILKKLQAVLCKSNESPEIQNEIRQFLEVDEKLTDIHFSLKVIVFDIGDVFQEFVIKYPKLITNLIAVRLENNISYWKKFMVFFTKNYTQIKYKEYLLRDMVDHILKSFTQNDLKSILTPDLVKLIVSDVDLADIQYESNQFFSFSEMKQFFKLEITEAKNNPNFIQNRASKAEFLRNQIELIFQKSKK